MQRSALRVQRAARGVQKARAGRASSATDAVGEWVEIQDPTSGKVRPPCVFGISHKYICLSARRAGAARVHARRHCRLCGGIL